MKRLFFGMVGALLVFAARAELFKDGETVCFLGDSITHGGRFHSYVYDYYLTRFPDRTVRFVNAGISGDSAGGAQGRLADDVVAKRPAAVVVMFGMNDVGRGLYVAEPSEQQRAGQQRARDNYRANMERLTARLKAEAGEPRLLFVTPSPFDQTGVNDRNNNQPGCNDGLARCAAIVHELAARNNGAVVDFHAPMTAFNLERQRQDPAFTIIGPDRVHPGAPGHLMMAWLFLKAQGAPALVSSVTIDAAAGRVVASENAAVTGLEKRDGGWSFTVLEQALPFPVDAAARPLLEWVPVERELNQEIVTVRGLAPGQYELRIDGAAVGRFSAEAFAKGVNLAFNEAVPQVRQAQAVARLNEARRSTETVLRNHAAVRWFLRHRKVDPDDLEAVRVYAETKMAKTGYYEGKVPEYLKAWGQRGEVIEKVADLERQAWAARKPVPHLFALVPVQP
ncbi:MAG: SGNH/GDSL hydrolase family protein [Kiritimatiellia bacterium]|jgi:lysophospholipase L1-like esterase|nr:SGNH/GDSL hydrolase family protein [Kiritimatiellia bacterium]MDD4172871.1 SGNH/GDSL hydrolase family protein [Kiritimatiellia bacterium]MDD4441497.1 SGNH/GDSL hydrolase family protein [Kiritimatiellia bacterium]MDX9792849.1 SGNH/GDSL hydrolase family protein [Kiritimatiellia bacterium]NLC81072.1 SGNH/GDSL hydrolase family protein [Lentisphaerota bacterium]